MFLVRTRISVPCTTRSASVAVLEKRLPALESRAVPRSITPLITAASLASSRSSRFGFFCTAARMS
jgi:hypothetical protein